MYYIIILDIFRAILCSSSGGLNFIVTASGIVTLGKQPYSAPVESGLIVTASGIVTLCKQPYSAPVESGLQSALNRFVM
jgi:hypothetical protein